MGNRFTHDEQNPLANFSLDPEDRLVHATTKRQAASVVEQNEQAMSSSWQAQEQAEDQAIGGFDPQDVGEDRPFVSHHDEYAQAQVLAQNSAQTHSLGQSQIPSFGQGAGQGSGQAFGPGYVQTQDPALAHDQSQYQASLPAQGMSSQSVYGAYGAMPRSGAGVGYQYAADSQGERSSYGYGVGANQESLSGQAMAQGQGDFAAAQDFQYDSNSAQAYPQGQSYPQGLGYVQPSHNMQEQGSNRGYDAALAQGQSQALNQFSTQISNQGQSQVQGQNQYQNPSAAYAPEAQTAVPFQSQAQSLEQSSTMGSYVQGQYAAPASAQAQTQLHAQTQDQALGQGQSYGQGQVQSPSQVQVLGQNQNSAAASDSNTAQSGMFTSENQSIDAQALFAGVTPEDEGINATSNGTLVSAGAENATASAQAEHNGERGQAENSYTAPGVVEYKAVAAANVSGALSSNSTNPANPENGSNLTDGSNKTDVAKTANTSDTANVTDATDAVNKSVGAAGNGAGNGAANGTGDSTEEAQGNFLYKWREARRAEKQAKQEHKEAIKAGLIPPPTKWQRFKHFCHVIFSLGWKIGVAGLCVCIGLFIYFDSVVIDKYEVDDKWVLPAVVYSRPLELYPDQRLSLDQMVYELQLLKYREVSSPRKQGEYALNKKNGRIVLIKRQFQFPEGDEPSMSVLVEFDGKRVRRILNAQTQQELGYMRMDPVLLDRINRINPQEDRIFITLDEVPKELITTLIEIEDRSYYSHMGVNPMAIARAFVKNMIAGGVVEGGSTITQQLVKNYFLTNERSYSRKLKEIFMAISMNHRYTKDQILEAYMNEIYLGQNGNAGIYGFGLASYFYFGVPVAELSLDQMALLVGLIKGPSYYDPWRHPDNALERRNTVLGVLRNRGHISQERFEQESSKPLNVIARGQLNYTKTPAFMGLVKTEIGTRFKEEEERTGKDFLSGNGIRIFTSLDPQAQVAAESAVQNEIAAIEKERKLKNLEAAMIVSSWRTGEVSAVVGSSNPKFDGYNRVLDSKRQVGSLIKPFVYLTAFHQGYHLGSIVNDTPVQVKLPNGDIWAPKNDDKRFRGPIRVIRAMASSLNVPTVRIGMGSGLDNVINTLQAAGFKRKLDMYPSIVLGTPEISPYELNSMYVGMATEGIYRDLTTLRTIVKNGEIVYQRGSNRGERTLDPKDTYLAIYGMTEATRSGTGRKIHNTFPDVTIASKTGTTNDFRDSWTVGMDSDELSTVWVGFDNNKSTGLYGSTGAMRLYIAYLKERGVNSLELNKPEGVSFVNFDKKGNVLASGCEEPGMEMFPAREDRIQFVKQCNNFGEAGYDELPYAVPNRPYQQPGQVQPYMQSGVQPNVLPQKQPGQSGQTNMQGAQGSYQPMQPGQLWQQGQTQAPMPPNQDALQSSRVEDSQARDVEPVAPDYKAKPTQSSSSNIERQADSFEDQLLGL